MTLLSMIFGALAALSLPGQEADRVSEPTAVQAAAVIFPQVYRNWNVPCDTPGAHEVTVQIDITLDREGRITIGPTLVSPQDTPAYRLAAESALRALRETVPFRVPPGFEGGEYRPTFRLDRVCPAS